MIAPSGDTINLNGGNTFSENVAFAAGTSCTIQSYGTGMATIAGANTAMTLSFVNPSGAVVLSNVEITNADTTNTFFNTNIAFADDLVHLSGVTVSGCTITGGFVNLRTFVDPPGSGFVGKILIENNVISGCTNSGISIASNSLNRDAYGNVNITSNTISNIPGYSSAGASAVGVIVEGANGSMGPNFIPVQPYLQLAALTHLMARGQAVDQPHYFRGFPIVSFVEITSRMTFFAI